MEMQGGFWEREEIQKSKIFEGLLYTARNNLFLLHWMVCAGIDKHITFHCARHTYATLLLNKGVEIYTVSKLLGHTDVRTTLIYSRLLNKTKVDAINTIPNIF